MRKGSKKVKRKLFMLFAVFVVLFTSLFCSLKNSYGQVIEKKNEKDQLMASYQDLKDEEDMLQKEVLKMQDPEYIARYVREKYMYSKDGEIILRIGD